MPDASRRATASSIVGTAACTCFAIGTWFDSPAPAASWVQPVSGDWTDGSKWSTTPVYPNNGDSAALNAVGTAHTITSNTNITIGLLWLDSPDATLRVAGGQFRAADVTFSTPSHVNVGSGAFQVGTVIVGQGFRTRPLFVQSGARLTISDGSILYDDLTVRSGGVFVQNGGLNTLGGGGAVYGGSTFELNGGTMTGGSGISLAHDGTAATFEQSGGTLVLGGNPLRIHGAATYRMTGGVLDASGTGGGPIDLRGFLEKSNGHLTSGSIVMNTGSLMHSGGTGSVSRLQGNGTLAFSGGSLTVGSLNFQGACSVSGGTFLPANASMSGLFEKTAGTLNASTILFDGQFLHAGGASSIGSLYVNSSGAASGFSGGSLSTNGFTLSAGTLEITEGTISVAGTSTINAGATVAYSAGALDLGALDLRGGRVNLSPGGDKVLRSTSVAVTAAGGGADLSDNAMLVDYAGPTPIASIRDLIASHSITSSAALTNPNHALGYAEASALTSVPPIFGTVDASAILIRYTRNGDADLNQIVNLADFNRLAAHFGSTSAFWHDGDFDHDGNVNLNDFNLLAANFGLSAVGPGVTPQDWSVLAATVPEPTVVTGVVTLSLMRRRRPRLP